MLDRARTMAFRVLPALLASALAGGCLFETDRRAGGGSDVGNGGAVAGLVLDGDGSAAAGVTVRLRPADYLSPLPALARAAALDTLGEVRTGSDGRFRFARLDTGDYRVEILSSDSSRGALADFTLRSGTDSLRLSDSRLAATGSIRLGPIDGDTGLAWVRFIGMERTVALHAGEETVVENLPPGTYALRTASSNPALGGREARGIEVRSDSTTTVDGLSAPCPDRACDSLVVEGFLKMNGLPGDMGRVINASGRVTGLVFDWGDSTLRFKTMGALRRLNRVKTVRVEGPLLPDSLAPAFFDALAQMDSLWFLRLAGSGEKGISAVPGSLGKLTSLTQLYLMDDSLAALPSGIGNLRKLEMLFLRGNRLESLPEGVGSLAALRELHVSFNRLTAIPASILALPGLVKLDVFGNRLCDLEADEKAALKAKGTDPDNSGQVCE